MDKLTRKLTASQSFLDLLDLGGEQGYAPTLDVSREAGRRLADAYDQAQAALGDPRRVTRRSWNF